MIRQPETGFIAPTITPDDWWLGAIEPKVIRHDGDWRKYHPKNEHQAPNFESFGCTVFATHNQMEVYQKAVYGEEFNNSDRYGYINAGIKLGGAPPTWAYEAIRKKGVIDEPLLPMTASYEDYIQPNPMSKEYLKRGENWLSTHIFNHEWVEPANIKEALKFSPIAISVTAWIEENGLYVDKGRPNTHWTLCTYMYPDGRYHILDSYPPFEKILHPDHNIKYAKRIRIQKKEKVIQPKPIRFPWLRDFNLFRNWKISW